MKQNASQVAEVVIRGASTGPPHCPMACAPERVGKRVPWIDAEPVAWFGSWGLE